MVKPGEICLGDITCRINYTEGKLRGDAYQLKIKNDSCDQRDQPGTKLTQGQGRVIQRTII